MNKTIIKSEESEIARTVEELKKLPISVFAAVGGEDERRQRAERLIELGKSYKPAAERCSEKDAPNKSAQQSPDSGGKMLKSSWGYLFEIYGDKPFMVRDGEPFNNLFEDDPERPDYRKRDDFDIDRE